MKKIILYIAILLGNWACQQEMEELPVPILPEKGEKIPVSFNLTLPRDISYGTEMVPMSRAADDTIRANIANQYKAVIIKKIEEQWFIDTVLSPILDAKAKYSRLPIYKSTIPDPLRVELRPGIYKIGVFLNPDALAWNSELKKGLFVATDNDMQTGKNILSAAKIKIQGENYSWGGTPNKALALAWEVFSGMKDFEVKKNTEPGSTSTNVIDDIPIKRRVARLRYLLKVNENPATAGNFGETQYWMKATLTAPEGSTFCEGLDILGNPYHASRSSMGFYCSAEKDLFYSERDNNYYQMPVNIPSGFPSHGPAGPTNYSPFVLVDKDMDCTFTIEEIQGASEGHSYTYPTPLPIKLKLNGVSGFAFERNPKIPKKIIEGTTYYEAQLVDGVDVNVSFLPDYELNAIATEIPKKP